MDEMATKADVERVRKDLRATEKRLDAKIDGVATHVRNVKVDLDVALAKRVRALEKRAQG